MGKGPATGKEAALLEPATRYLALASVTVGILVVTLFPVRAGLLTLLHGGNRSDPGSAGLFHDLLRSLLEGLHEAGPGDILLNVLLFLPFGAFAIPSRPVPGSRLRKAALAALAGSLLSAGIEALQFLLPGRYLSPVDIVCNGLGAGAGAWLMLAWAERGYGDGEPPEGGSP